MRVSFVIVFDPMVKLAAEGHRVWPVLAVEIIACSFGNGLLGDLVEILKQPRTKIAFSFNLIIFVNLTQRNTSEKPPALFGVKLSL